MFNYIRSEIYRITHKKSFFIFYGILAAGFLLLMFVSGTGLQLTGENLMQLAYIMLNMAMMVVGIHVFITVYNDEISAHTLAGLIGHGLSRTAIILSKIIVMILVTIAAFIWLGLIFFGYYLILNKGIVSGDIDVFMTILKMGLIIIVSIVGFASIASIISYGSQKTAISITFLVLLISNFFAQIISLICSIGAIKSLVGDLSQYTFSVGANNLFTSMAQSTLNMDALLQVTLWIVASVAVAIIVFKKKELEF